MRTISSQSTAQAKVLVWLPAPMASTGPTRDTSGTALPGRNTGGGKALGLCGAHVGQDPFVELTLGIPETPKSVPQKGPVLRGHGKADCTEEAALASRDPLWRQFISQAAAD